MPGRVKRQYHSPTRDAQARRTRRAIVDAARELFVRSGFAATSLHEIAAAAAVATQTVHATFGSKRALLAEVLDVAIAGDDDAIAVNDRTWMRDVFEHPRATTRLRAYAAAVRHIHERAGDVFGVVQAAAAADHDLVPLATTTEQRRRTGAAGVVRGLDELGALREGLTPAAATDLLWTFNSPELFRLLVRGSGWTPDAYEHWLATTLQQQLLGRTARTPRRPD